MKKSHQYWDLSVNPIWHTCTKVSAGCTNCWAKAMGKRFPEIRKIVECPKPELHLEAFDKLNKQKPQVVFLQLLGDLFHEDIPFEWIRQIIIKAYLQNNNIYLVCTKRAKRMVEFFKWIQDDFENIYFGVSVEDQSTLWRIEELEKIPNVKKWVSFEPLLGYIEFKDYHYDYTINFIAIGCETGSKRLCAIDDIGKISHFSECLWAKHWIKQIPINGKSCNDIKLFPKDLQIRERP